MTKRNKYKACCGNQVYLITLDKPIRKSQIEIFKTAGFSVPDNFFNSGIFYVKKGDLIGTCAYGTTQINLRAGNTVTEKDVDAFQELLEKATGAK